MANNSQSLINLICSMSGLVINLVIGFWLSPFIIRTIGVEANGFISLAASFISYASLIEMALGSMASRFITLEYVKGNFEKANLYYNSVFWGRILLVLFLIGPAIYLIYKLENFINIPSELKKDVQIMFSVMFASFFMSLSIPHWSVATFATNKLHRSYIPDTLMGILRALLIFGAFILLSPKVYYLSIIALIISIITISVQWYNKKLLVKELSLSLKKGKRIFSLKAIWELISSGIWNTISSIGNMLLSGLDLLVCNIFLGPTAMGVLALSKVLPMHIQSLSATVRGAYNPSITIGYAKGDMEDVYHELKKAMKTTAFIMIIPIAGIVTFGDWFYSLWVPSQDAQLLQILSIIGIVGYMFTSGTQILYNVFGAVNKVRQNSIAMVLSGVVSIGLMYTLVKYTGLGILAFGGVSMIVNLTRNMTFTLPATAKYLGFSWKRFYPQVGQTVLASIILIVIGQLMKPWLPSGTWINFIISALLFFVIALPVSFYILFNRDERRFLLFKVGEKFKAKISRLNNVKVV